MVVDYRDLFPDDTRLERLWVNAAALPQGPELAAAHLLAQGFGEDVEQVLQCLQVQEDRVRAVFDQLRAPDAWPVFSMPLGSGARLTVAYRNLADDSGVDYLLHSGPEEPLLRIASAEGHFHGPGLSWDEILVAEHYAGDATDAAWRTVLLSPACGDLDAMSDSPGHLAAAFDVIGCAGDSSSLAELVLMNPPMWEPARWTTSTDGVTTCDGPHSYRNPAAPDALPRTQLATVSRALSPG